MTSPTSNRAPRYPAPADTLEKIAGNIVTAAPGNVNNKRFMVALHFCDCLLRSGLSVAPRFLLRARRHMRQHPFPLRREIK
jgi:hypothetical protein